MQLSSSPRQLFEQDFYFGRGSAVIVREEALLSTKLGFLSALCVALVACQKAPAEEPMMKRGDTVLWESSGANFQTVRLLKRDEGELGTIQRQDGSLEEVPLVDLIPLKPDSVTDFARGVGAACELAAGEIRACIRADAKYLCVGVKGDCNPQKIYRLPELSERAVEAKFKQL